jgi:hypothetical protein
MTVLVIDVSHGPGDLRDDVLLVAQDISTLSTRLEKRPISEHHLIIDDHNRRVTQRREVALTWYKQMKAVERRRRNRSSFA